MTKRGMDVQKLQTNTARLTSYAQKHGIELKSLNNGIQLRLSKGGRSIDFYPSTGRIVGAHKYEALPIQKAGFSKAMAHIFPAESAKPKVPANPLDRTHHFVYEDRLYSLRQLFSKRIATVLRFEVQVGGGYVVHLRSWENPRTKEAQGWRLHSKELVQYALELAKQHGADIRRGKL